MVGPTLREMSALAKQLRLDVAQLTDVGRKREHNEDNMAFVIPKDSQVMASKGALFIVADGMGGHAAGEVASEIAVDTVSNMYYQEDSNDVTVSLLRAIRRANASIHQRAAENLLRTGMGTTCVAAVLRGNMAYIANVGDSRAYLLRGNQVKQISYDHSWVAEQVRAGLLTEEQARTHAQRNVITRCLGTQAEVDVDVFHEALHEGDSLVLCTDGLSGLVSDEELQRIVEQFVPQESVYHLVERANENGGPDNITAIVMRVQEVGEEPPSVRYPVVVGGREMGEDTVTLGMFSDTPLGSGSSNGDIAISSGPLRLSSGPLISSPDSITAPQPAIGKHQSVRSRLFYPILVLIALLVIGLFGGGAFYYFRSNESQAQAANQALDAAQQQLTNVSSESPSSALKTLATTQKALTDVQSKYQLNGAQMQRLTQLQNELVGNVQHAISAYNQDAKINLLLCNSSKHPIDNTSTNTSPESIVFADGFTSNPFLYTLGLDNHLYRINGQYGMVSPLTGKATPQFSSLASNGSLLFLMQKQVNGNSQAPFTLSVYKPGQQGTLDTPISSALIGANFTTNGYMPVFITAWNNSVHVVLSSQTDQGKGNPRILSYVLDTKQHLSTPKESQISISAPLVSIAAFPSQLFLLLSSGDVQSLSLVNGNQPSSLPMPVLVQSQIAPPLATTTKYYNATTAVPTVTPVDSNGSTALSIPSSQGNPAMLAAGQIGGVPHLYIGDPGNYRVLNLESIPGGSLTPTSTRTTGTTNGVKLQLDQQYVSYPDFKQVKSLAAVRKGDQLATLTQIPPSTANLVSIQTGTQNGVLENCPSG
ncbi:MAG TPA: Stp1/IreP family PP2C-type Ser/Thr phosphatase [Ktedonobacteraceae bacterium]|nr:Stp1/IreP family PP2C-type Ser/Thr phosphatase [Ktedonobacteraceae bacterium]